jgi:hypothetical protein
VLPLLVSLAGSAAAAPSLGRADTSLQVRGLSLATN